VEIVAIYCLEVKLDPFTQDPNENHPLQTSSNLSQHSVKQLISHNTLVATEIHLSPRTCVYLLWLEHNSYFPSLQIAYNKPLANSKPLIAKSSLLINILYTYLMTIKYSNPLKNLGYYMQVQTVSTRPFSRLGWGGGCL